MVQENVIKLVRKKGEDKKPRGRKAVALIALKRKAAEPKRRVILPDKRHPFKPFIYMYREELADAMDEFVENAGWTNDRNIPDPVRDREMIRMFNILRSGIPYVLVKQFFVEFDATPSDNILTFFEDFQNRPEIRDRIFTMKRFLKKREAVPAEIIKPVRNIILEPKSISPPKYVQPVKYSRSEIPNVCESEYKRAPWMIHFTQKRIKGLALKENSNFTRNDEIIPGWYVANDKWYAHVCKNGRDFIPDAVAYITFDDDVLIETLEMYEESLKTNRTEFERLNEFGYAVARSMLMENQTLINHFKSTKELERNVDAIVKSFGPFLKTNADMIYNLARVLSFLDTIEDDTELRKALKKLTFVTDVELEFEKEVRDRYSKLLIMVDPTIKLSKKNVKTVATINIGRKLKLPETVKQNIFKVDQELAPGLFAKLRNLIANLDQKNCAMCGQQIYSAKYKTVKDSRVLEFCGLECFEDFSF